MRFLLSVSKLLTKMDPMQLMKRNLWSSASEYVVPIAHVVLTEFFRHVNNAAPTYPGNFKRALEDFDVNDDGLIDYAEFCELERRYPLILFPAFRLQDALQRHSLGEKAWLRIIENYNKQKKIEEYKATHGGKLPPDPFGTRLAKSCCPCMFREKVHIRLGADMEARHRAMKGEPPKK
mmetsp:Transcript_14638/g.22077  ORF Transcript_14638/g.22077 Transcript_14638/m.22077 type:complete len:178 (-) Transcript_14638:174-707(-)